MKSSGLQVTYLGKRIGEFFCAQRQCGKVQQFRVPANGRSGTQALNPRLFSSLQWSGSQKTWSWLSANNGLSFSFWEMREGRPDDFQVLCNNKILSVRGRNLHILIWERQIYFEKNAKFYIFSPNPFWKMDIIIKRDGGGDLNMPDIQKLIPLNIFISAKEAGIFPLLLPKCLLLYFLQDLGPYSWSWHFLLSKLSVQTRGRRGLKRGSSRTTKDLGWGDSEVFLMERNRIINNNKTENKTKKKLNLLIVHYSKHLKRSNECGGISW